MGSDYSESIVSQDVASLPQDFFPAAGLSTFRRTHHANAKAHFSKGETQTDLSMVRGPRWKRRSMPRLDPASMHGGFPAGGVTKENRLECHKAKIANKMEERTDPITHFKHDPSMTVRIEKKDYFAKKMGYDHHAAVQHWTWQQDPKVVAAMGLGGRPEFVYQKFQVGADGKRYYNVCGVEDLLPAGTQEHLKCDLQPPKEHIRSNDREMLPYCIREGHPQRPVHSHFQSDDIWAIMKHEGYLKMLQKEKDKLLRPSAETQTTPRFQEASWSEGSEDEDYSRRDNSFWIRSDSSVVQDPSLSAPSNRGLALSMTPRSLNRSARTSRSLTPRSSLRTSRSLTPRSSPLDSTIKVASSPETRSKPSTTPASFSTTEQPRIQATTSKQLASQSEAPRNAASRNSAASLSMTPQLISRRIGGSTPLNLTPRSVAPGSTRSEARTLKKSASDTAIR